MLLKHYGEGDLSWWLPTGMGKSAYYVWFLGARPTTVLRCPDTVLAVLRRLLILPPTLPAPPPKLTIQISEKGVKLSPATVSSAPPPGKRKTKPPTPPGSGRGSSLLPPHAVAFSLIGPAPYRDAVAVVMLTPCQSPPAIIHAYRCDSPETAAHMHSCFQELARRSDTTRRVAELETRLGLPAPPPRRTAPRAPESPMRRAKRRAPSPPHRDHPHSSASLSPVSSDPQNEDSEDSDYDEVALYEKDGVTTKVASLHRILYRELKERLRLAPSKAHGQGVVIPPKDYTSSPLSEGALTSSTSGLGSDLSSASKWRFSMSQLPWGEEERVRDLSPPVRMFGDTVRQTQQAPRRQYRQSRPAPPPHRHGGGNPAALQRLRLHRSVDNLASAKRSSWYMPPTARLF